MAAPGFTEAGIGRERRDRLPDPHHPEDLLVLLRSLPEVEEEEEEDRR